MGVYFADDRPFTTAARIRAAVWSRGSQAVASGLAAAWWHGLMTVAPDPVEVTVPRTSHWRAPKGIGCGAETWLRLTLSSTAGCRSPPYL